MVVAWLLLPLLVALSGDVCGLLQLQQQLLLLLLLLL